MLIRYMNINERTKVIARLHTSDNGTGLNIYNPYFESVKLNAVYLLFKGDNPKPLIDGISNLGMCGAITAGFEHDPTIANLVDFKSESVELTNIVGIIYNKNGKLHAHYQGGEGLLSAILEKIDINGKRIVIVGAGTVARALILAIKQSSIRTASITVVNRTVSKAEEVIDLFDLGTKAIPLDKLEDVEGDILINASRVGSIAEDQLFMSNIIKRFKAAVDVTFGNPNTSLIRLARLNSLVVIDGWDMFTHQAAVVLRNILDHKADIPKLREFVSSGLSNINHGAKPK